MEILLIHPYAHEYLLFCLPKTIAEHNHVIAVAFFTVSWMIIDPLGTG